MNKNIQFAIVFFLCSAISLAQSSNNTNLYIIDSIPQMQGLENWNPVTAEDIAEMRTATGKDTLEKLGFGQYQTITYIFTKAYRNRADSLKKIPSLKQMEFVDETWRRYGMPYYGRFINYFNNGSIMNEGVLFEGRLNGELKTYFKNGKIKSIATYEDGLLNGASTDYYTNGIQQKTTEFEKGKEKPVRKTYFINGLLESEMKPKQGSRYDTLFIYYSTGKTRQIKLMKKGEAVISKKEDYINYYSSMFYRNLHLHNMKQANKFYLELLMLDSSCIDTYFSGGMLMMEESRFERAIGEFDKVLALEPLMKEALLNRAIARMRKYQQLKTKEISIKANRKFRVEDIATIPVEEQEKICNDLRQAEYLDGYQTMASKKIPETILQYCRLGIGQ